MSRSKWVSRFKVDRTSVDYDERPGRSMSSSEPEMIEKMRYITHEDRRQTIDEVSALVGHGFSTTTGRQPMLPSRFDGFWPITI